MSEGDVPSAILQCLLSGIPKLRLAAITQSKIRLNLISLVSDLAVSSTPDLQDIHNHQDVLEAILQAFPNKCPTEKDMLAAVLSLDSYYNFNLAKYKATAVSLRKTWALQDVSALRFLLMYIFDSVRSRAGAQGSHDLVLRRLKSYVQTPAVARRRIMIEQQVIHIGTPPLPLT